MGNDASTMAAKHKFNSTLEEINEGLGALTKEGPTNKKEAKERREQREDEYKKKQRERQERKAKLTEMWAANRPKPTNDK